MKQGNAQDFVPTNGARPRPNARVAWITVGVGTAALIGRALVAERQTVDDVFIFLRYARTLAEHGEYAFNRGMRVEGTSSVAWTLLLGVAWRAGARGVGLAKAASLAAATFIPAMCALAVRRSVPDRPLAMALPAIALALDADLATWAASGMDTALWALACVGCVALAATGRLQATAVGLGALAWFRPEGPLFTVLGLTALAQEKRSALRLATLAAAPLALLTLIRFVYFHDLVPNTFWAKMNAADGKDYTGLGYLLNALERRPLLLLVLPVAALRMGRAMPGVRVAIALLVASFVFALSAGGDWMPGRRLLVCALPLAAVAGAVAFAQLRMRALAIAACATLVGEAALTFDHAVDQQWRDNEWADKRVAHWTFASRPFSQAYVLDWMPTYLLHTVAPYVAPGDTVAHVDVGELPYVMGDVEFLDGFGLVDRKAGRLAFAPHDQSLRRAARESLFERRPAAAIIVIDESNGRPFSPAQDAALADPRFAAGWREIARVPTWGSHPCVTYVRRDIVAAPSRVAEQRVQEWLHGVPDVVAAF